MSNIIVKDLGNNLNISSNTSKVDSLNLSGNTSYNYNNLNNKPIIPHLYHIVIKQYITMDSHTAYGPAFEIYQGTTNGFSFQLINSNLRSFGWGGVSSTSQNQYVMQYDDTSIITVQPAANTATLTDGNLRGALNTKDGNYKYDATVSYTVITNQIF